MFQPINKFFSRFSKITVPDKSVREQVCFVVKNVCDINLSIEEVRAQNGIVFITPRHPAIKSEIFLHQEKI